MKKRPAWLTCRYFISGIGDVILAGDDGRFAALLKGRFFWLLVTLSNIGISDIKLL